MVPEVDYADLANSNEFTHYEVNIPTYAVAGDNHTITLIDASSELRCYRFLNRQHQDQGRDDLRTGAPCTNGDKVVEWTFENHTVRCTATKSARAGRLLAFGSVGSHD